DVLHQLCNHANGIAIARPHNTIVKTTPDARDFTPALHDALPIISSYRNVVEGDYIGTEADGIHQLGNDANGIAIEGLVNTIGGTTADARAVISGKPADGVLISCYSNVVEGDYIGTAAHRIHEPCN